MLAAVTSWWAYLPALAICGFGLGLGLGSTAASIASQQVAGPRQAGQVSGISLTTRTTAAGISLAVTANIVDAFEHGGHGVAAACDRALLIITAFLPGVAALIATAARYALAQPDQGVRVIRATAALFVNGSGLWCIC